MGVRLTVFNKIYLIWLMLAACFCTLPALAAKSAPLIIKAHSYPLSTTCSACNNFYNYVCSESIKKYRLPADRSGHSFAFGEISEQILKAKKTFLVNLAHYKIADSLDPTTQQIQEEVRNYFLSVYDSRARYQQELEAVRASLARVKRLNSREACLEYLAKNPLDHWYAHLVTSWIAGNLYNPEEPELAISTHHLLSLSSVETYRNKELITDFRRLITQFFEVLDQPSPQLMANQIVNFQLELSKIAPTHAQMRQWSTIRTVLDRKTALQRFTNLQLEHLFNAIPEDTTIVVDADPELKVLAWVNAAVGEMNLLQLQSLILYQELFDIVSIASKPFRKAKRDFRVKHLGAPPKELSKLDKAVTSTMRLLGRELDYLMLSYVFLDFPKQRVMNLVARIRQSLLNQLSENDWLSPEGKAATIDKIKKLTFSIAYPDNFEDWRIFQPVTLSAAQPLTNAHILHLRNQQEGLKLLKRKRIEKTWWAMKPLTVNAYYDPTFNRMVIPLGILQPPFFDPSLPDEANLGGIGSVIGHEMGHAIDDIGSKFDATGKLRDWMPQIDRERFKQRVSKLIKQFDAIGHQGSFTLGENIGDLVGITTAYRAINISGRTERARTANSNSGDIAALKRQFFVQFAKLWCNCERPGITKQRLLTDPHALNWARTNQNVKQIPDFVKVFQCKPNDPMQLAPHEQVKIW